MALPDAILRALFDGAALPLVLVDGRGVLAMWNAAFDSLFRSVAGLGPERLSGSFFDFLESREGARFDYYAAAILMGGHERATVESPVRAADGSLRWLRLALSRVETSVSRGAAGPSQAPEGERFLLCVAEDVTDRVQREKLLRDAKEEAEKATHTKSQFLANMSHEIRTPIQTIIGVAELLRETELDTEQADYANQVRFSAEVLLALINDVLDFSKIEAGRLELETTSFDLRSWVYQSVDLLAMEANRKGLEIVVDVDESLPALVRGDPGRLRQVIVNLFKNAVKFTKEGGVALSLQRVSTPGGPMTRFEVADTGPGMSDSVRERLFTPFYQGDLSQARKTGGTGLGLAISRHLVELMGGAIGVRPAPPPGSGSVFWFDLPLEAPVYSAPPRSTLPIAAMPRAGLAQASPDGGPRLLVVDDYPLARDFAAKSAAAAGYRVSEAGSGEEALEQLRRAAAEGEPFTACLVDQNMPKMDGWRLASEITGDTAINGTRLILMAPIGAISADAKMKLLRWFDGYLSKPVKPGELLDILARSLSSEVDLESAEPEGPARPKRPEPRFEADVLLAEDHEVNRELFTLLLARMGCSVVTARDGIEAVEIGSSRRFDLILMDIFMPRMSGYEAARALRSKGYDGPIIAVTASALHDERDNCIAAGMDDILVKPFKKEELAAILAARLPSLEVGSSGLAEGQGPAPARADQEGNIGPPGPDEPLDSSVFDWEGVVDTFLGQDETVVSLLRRFADKAARQLDELEGALAARDAARFKDISHSLKGAAWNLSARRLGDAALACETAGKEGDLAEAAGRLTAMRAAFDGFARAIRPHIGEASPPSH
jgi:PAS domain S-box-containing protein